MSNNNTKNENKSSDNKAVTGVEVVKDDTVVFEDGDFEEYNDKHDYEEATNDSSIKESSDQQSKSDEDKAAKEKHQGQSSSDKNTDQEQKSAKKDKSDEGNKEDKSDESDKEKSDKQTKSDKKDKASKKDNTEQEDKSGITMAGIYQWASKLKDDFKSDASGMTQEVSEKATAMMLSRLIDAVDMELAAFDKSLEVAKNLVATAEEKRKEIAARKEKYQGMIDKLDQE